MPAPVLTARGVTKRYAKRPDLIDRGLVATGLKPPGDIVRAVNGVDLDILPGEIVGIVGESGCGKSTLGRLLVGLEAPDEGRITFANDRQFDRFSKNVLPHVHENPSQEVNARQSGYFNHLAVVQNLSVEIGQRSDVCEVAPGR